jgi:hypothetical protein
MLYKGRKKVKYSIGKSVEDDPIKAVDEATKGIRNPKLIIFFSGVTHFEEYTKEIKRAFPDSISMGTTTFVSLCKEGAYKETLFVLGIEDGIECYGDVLEEVDRYPLKYVERVEACAKKMQKTTNSICFEFSTALLCSEESILATLNSVLLDYNIPVVGGSAGDKGVAEKTMVSFDGKVCEKACVFVIIRNLGGKINLYRENIYKPTNHYFTATKVDNRTRTVFEYDNKPAAEMIAKALNTDIKTLPKYLDSHPMGRLVGSHMYITANCKVDDNKGMVYHTRVYNNSKMVLLEPDNYKEVIDKTIEKIHTEVPNPSLTIMVHCLARSILFEGDGYLEEFAKKMGHTLGNYVGFAGYGEQVRQQHFNQTMVLAVFE